MDFGFAKQIESTSATFTLCGTPEYLAPEILLRKGHNYGVDNYAVGILIYEMETGETPFCDPSGQQNTQIIMEKIINRKPKFSKHINARSKQFVTQLLKKNVGIGPILLHPRSFYLCLN